MLLNIFKAVPLYAIQCPHFQCPSVSVKSQPYKVYKKKHLYYLNCHSFRFLFYLLPYSAVSFNFQNLIIWNIL